MKNQQGYTAIELAIMTGIGVTVFTTIGAVVIVVHFVAKYW